MTEPYLGLENGFSLQFVLLLDVIAVSVFVVGEEFELILADNDFVVCGSSFLDVSCHSLEVAVVAADCVGV